MEVKILWSDTSLVQLQEIFDFYCFNASVAVARNIVKGIVERSLVLETNPLIGAPEPLLKKRSYEYRYLIHKNYKIIYRYNNNIILVVSIFDSRQNPRKLKKIDI
jgi:toxin ParE1/3/4